MIRLALLAFLLVLSGLASADDTPLHFDSPELAARYDNLLNELRCLVCQNQSLADSHAELAQDLRNEVHRMLNAGDSDDAIREFMVARYGDFVLYRPPLKLSTVALWLAPLLLFVLALGVILRRGGKAPAPAAQTALSDEERARLSTYLDDERPTS